MHLFIKRGWQTTMAPDGPDCKGLSQCIIYNQKRHKCAINPKNFSLFGRGDLSLTKKA